MHTKSIGGLIISTLCFISGCAVQSEGIEVTGRLSMKGTGKHHYIALSDTKHQKIYKILNTQDYNISKYQNSLLTLHIKVIKEERGIGFPAEVEVLDIP